MTPEHIKAIGALWPLVLILFLIIVFLIYNKSIFKWLGTLITFKGKIGGTELTIEKKETTVLLDLNDRELGLPEKETSVAKNDQLDFLKNENNKDADVQVIDMFIALQNNQTEQAENFYKQLLEKQTTDIERQKINLYFLYFKFLNGFTTADSEIIVIRNDTSFKENKEFTYKLLGRAYAISKNYSKSVDEYTSLYSLTDKSQTKVDAIIGMSEAYYELGEKEKALKVLTSDLDNKLFDSDSKYKLVSEIVKFYSKENDSFNKLISLNQLLKIKSNDLDAIFNAAYAASECGFNELTVYYYKLYMNFNSNNGTVLNNLGVAYDSLSLHSKANECYQSSIEKGESIAAGNLATTYIKNGFFEHANKLLQDAVKKEFIHEKVKVALEYLSTEQKSANEKDIVIEKISQKHQLILSEYSDAYYDIEFTPIEFTEKKIKQLKNNKEVSIEKLAGNIIVFSWKDEKTDNADGAIMHTVQVTIFNRAINAQYNKPEIVDSSGFSFINPLKYEKRVSVNRNNIDYKGFIEKGVKKVILFRFADNSLEELQFSIS